MVYLEKWQERTKLKQVGYRSFRRKCKEKGKEGGGVWKENKTEILLAVWKKKKKSTVFIPVSARQLGLKMNSTSLKKCGHSIKIHVEVFLRAMAFLWSQNERQNISNDMCRYSIFLRLCVNLINHKQARTNRSITKLFCPQKKKYFV